MVIAAGAAAALALVATPAVATTTVTDGQAQKIDQVLASDGTSAIATEERDTFVAEVEAAAAENGTTFDQVLDKVKAESDASIAEAMADSSTGTGSCGTRVALGDGRHVGDVFYSPSSSYGIVHGHSGIYYTLERIEEAPGGGVSSRDLAATASMVCEGTQKQEIIAPSTGNLLSLDKRQAAATKSHADYDGKPYDNDFAFNKTNGSSKLNCSELVWRAYKMSTVANIELDADGGYGVYPVDIKNDEHTHTYREL